MFEQLVGKDFQRFVKAERIIPARMSGNNRIFRDQRLAAPVNSSGGVALRQDRPISDLSPARRDCPG